MPKDKNPLSSPAVRNPKIFLTIANSETRIDVTEFANKDVAMHATNSSALCTQWRVRHSTKREKRGRGLLAAPL